MWPVSLGRAWKPFLALPLPEPPCQPSSQRAAERACRCRWGALLRCAPACRPCLIWRRYACAWHLGRPELQTRPAYHAHMYRLFGGNEGGQPVGAWCKSHSMLCKALAEFLSAMLSLLHSHWAHLCTKADGSTAAKECIRSHAWQALSMQMYACMQFAASTPAALRHPQAVAPHRLAGAYWLPAAAPHQEAALCPRCCPAQHRTASEYIVQHVIICRKETDYLQERDMLCHVQGMLVACPSLSYSNLALAAALVSCASSKEAT